MRTSLPLVSALALAALLQGCADQSVTRYDSLEATRGQARALTLLANGAIEELKIPKKWTQVGEDRIIAADEPTRTYGSVRREYKNEEGITEEDFRAWWSWQETAGDDPESLCIDHIDGAAITCDVWQEEVGGRSVRLTATYTVASSYDEQTIAIKTFAEK